MTSLLTHHGRSPRKTNLCIHRIMVLAALWLTMPSLALTAEAPLPQLFSPLDSDGDGLSDELEQALLARFVPAFLVAPDDCSHLPAEFQPGTARPVVQTENGAIYGQISPRPATSAGTVAAEIHYYHLWKRDCGGHGHPLDSEHVSVWIQAPVGDSSPPAWKAAYWYAAAHENTVCDVSQIARATTLEAEDRGAKIWISQGKHASYLDQKLCQGGCGADRCENSTELQPAKLINLGEAGKPMNNSTFIASADWPLNAKMAASNFPPATLTRLNSLPASEIARFNPGKHPSQGIVAISSTTALAIGDSGRQTIDSLSTASESTDRALGAAKKSSRSALATATHSTLRALGASARNVGKALQIKPSAKHSNDNKPSPSVQ